MKKICMLNRGVKALRHEGSMQVGLSEVSIGFTLAEVLITLGIIGVVAAMTMPTLVTHYQKAQTLTKLKKIYSTLNQAFKMSEIENGEFEYWENVTDIGRHAYFEKYWKPFLKGAQYCKNYVECGYIEQYPWQTLSGNRKNDYGLNSTDGDGYNYADYTLPDGVFLSFRGGGFIIDLNGSKGPNIYGKDVFVDIVTSSKGVTANCNNWTEEILRSYCSKSNHNESACCATRIINLDNWQIKDDYPW